MSAFLKLLFFILISNYAVKLNGGRRVVGILRGFDPFMNMVIDESIEECKDGTKNNIGMVVSFSDFIVIFMKVNYGKIKCFIILNHLSLSINVY